MERSGSVKFEEETGSIEEDTSAAGKQTNRKQKAAKAT